MIHQQPVHHLSDASLVAYTHQQLTDAQREEMDRHLEVCLDCRRRLLEHAAFQRGVSEGLSSKLAQVYPETNWPTIMARVRRPNANRRFLPAGLMVRGMSRRKILWLVATVYAIVVLVGGFLLFTVIRNSLREQQTVSLVDTRPTATTRPTPVLGGASITNAPTAEPTPTVAGPPVWDGEGRVNLLVLGIDQRGNQEGYWRTDTMIIVTVDPRSRTVGMVSIPRDLWVPIWGYDIEDRINTAHYYGDARSYPGGGPALARDTVAYNLGIPIHHYVRLNFTAFERLIDEIGGIDIYVERTINDPLFPDEGDGYDPFYLSAGQHHLDGRIALKYARSRHGTSDFDRAQRQQQVMLAIRDQVVRLNQLPRLIANGPQILNTLGNAVRTDLSLDQAEQLARILNDIPPASYRGAVIDQTYTQPYTTDNGWQVLIPLRDRIAQLYESFFQGQ